MNKEFENSLTCDNKELYSDGNQIKHQRDLIAIFEPSLLQLICMNCGKHFSHAAIVSHHYNGVFCSRDCLFAKHGWKRVTLKEGNNGRETTQQ